MNITLDDLPTAIMGLTGLMLLLLALKAKEKAALKFFNALISLILMAGAMWWFIRRH